MSLYKSSPKNQKQRDSNERSPQIARQNSLEQQFNSSGSTPNEAAILPVFQHPLQGNIFYQQQNPSWSLQSSQTRMPFENFGNIAPVDLIVSNLDLSIDVKEIYNMLLNMFKQYCTILDLTINLQGNIPLANIKVTNNQEAQAAITQLDSRWLGCKRIKVSYLLANVDQLRMVVISLLKNVPGQCMPLFKFFEIVRSRYLTNISLSEINSLEDVCKIIDDLNGRMIVLNQKVNFNLPLANTLNYYCTFHCPNGLANQGWGEPYEFNLPNVRIPLRYFQNQIHQLLLQHMGSMPLLSFPTCYAIHFKQILPEDDAGVPLEHLVTCFSTIELVSNDQNKNIKYLKLKEPKDIKMINLDDVLVNTISPEFLENVAILCREMVDLLKNVQNCQLLLSSYIPSYYSHFGRQCRVADYGFNRLSDLFKAISHVVQILGYGPRQVITLTHYVQIRRFTTDLLRVIKSQRSKKLSIVRFPRAYEQAFFRVFNPVEYGLCSLEDLLCNVQEGTLVFSKVDNMDVISISKREFTAEEIKRTKQFTLEVKEILRHFPYCTMAFNKFLPSYHQCFGRECKIIDYGFTKLIELFEAIPETVEIDGFFDMDRKIILALEPLLEIVGTQLITLIKESNQSSLYFDEIISIFRQTIGYSLIPERFDCATLLEMFIKLGDFVQVHFTKQGGTVSVVNVETQVLELRLWALLLHPPHNMGLKKLKYLYRLRFESNLPTYKLDQIKSVEISKSENNTLVSLSHLYMLAARIYHLLAKKERTQVCDIPDLYFYNYGTYLFSRDYGAKSLKHLLLQMNFLVKVNGKDNNLWVTLNKKLSDYGVFVLKQTKSDKCTWPPTPLHLLNGRSHLFTPPKPDTPSFLGCWSDAWNLPQELSNPYLNLQISLPLKDDDNKSEDQSDPNAFIVIPQDTSMTHAVHEDSGYSGFNASRRDFSVSDAEISHSNQLLLGVSSNSNIFNMSFNRSM